MKNLLTALFILLITQAQSQTGTITGKVIDSKTGEDIIGAIVQIEGTTKGAPTDLFGEYRIEGLEPGTYNLECRLVSYAPKKITGVNVKDGETVVVDISMEEQVVEGAMVEIVDFKKTNTEAAVLIEMKEARGVLSGVSNAQIAKSQDRNASEVARRIPGVTVVDNRFVMVRGLTERYNSVMMNGILVPSLETDVRSFSFDLIPSSMIDRFLIYKSPSPDLQGEFAGGAINVYTRNFPDARTSLDLNIGTGFRVGTTGDAFRTNVNDKSELFGFDGGSRDLPSDFPENVRNVTNPSELQALGRMLPNNWNFSENNASPDFRVNATIGKRFKYKDVLFGNFTSVNYTNTRVTQPTRRIDYNVYDEVLNQSDTVFTFNDDIFQERVNVGILHNWGVRMKNHSFEFKNFLNQTGEQSNTFRTGAAIEEGSERKEYSYRYTERRIYSMQLAGNHKTWGERGQLNWALGYGATRRQDPDWRRIRYTRPLDGSDPLFHAYIPFSAQPFFLGRLFMNLKEDIRSATFSYEHKVARLNGEGEKEQWLTIKAGGYIEDRDRRFGSRNLGYAISSIFGFDYSLDTLPVDQILAPENVNFINGFKLDEDTRGADTYHASSNLNAYYLMLNIPYGKWNVSGGVRIEDNRQSLTSADITGNPVMAELDSTMVLPSVNISYNLTEKMLIRAGYGKTVNRPEFRELAPFTFYDFENNFIIAGNPNLNFAVIDNYDLRWELYPRPTEFISVAAFYKVFDNPIEQYFVPGVGSGGTRSFQPGNAMSATSYGFEVDIRKSLADFTASSFIHQLSVVANASWINSDIELSPEGIETGLNPNRTMVGQSPYIINGGLYWENDSLGLQVSVLYNIIGERVVIVGIPDLPEVYEMPRHMLDISVTKTFKNGFGIRAGIQDTFNQDFVLLQDANLDGTLDRSNDQRIQYFNRGQYLSLALTYRFREN